jgi:hypothetical protein
MTDGTRKRAGGEDTSQVPAAAGELLPSARDARPVDLCTVRDIRRALASVWRDVRAGHLPAADGARLAFMAHTLAKLVELETFEARITALEGHHASERMGDAARTH